MLRFLSRRNRNHQNIHNVNSSDIKSQRIPTNKNLIQCRVILLDNSDISIELSVSDHNWIIDTCKGGHHHRQLSNVSHRHKKIA